MDTILVHRLSNNAFIPKRGSVDAAGFDLFSSHNIVVNPGKWEVISTDIALSFPDGFYGKISGRSGLLKNFGVIAFHGTVDRDYRGNIKILLLNTRKTSFNVRKGDRIAQIIPVAYFTGVIKEVDCLPNTERQDGAFGSTGR